MKRSEIGAWLDAEVRRRHLAELPNIGPPLKNPRHELFVRCCLSLYTCKAAYLACGYSTNAASVKGNAAKIRHRPDVAERIDAVQRYLAERMIQGL